MKTGPSMRVETKESARQNAAPAATMEARRGFMRESLEQGSPLRNHLRDGNHAVLVFWNSLRSSGPKAFFQITRK